MQRFTIYLGRILYMLRTGFPSIIGSSKLHIQRQVFVRPLLLPAASLAGLTADSSIGLTLYVQFWASDDGRKIRLKHVQRRTEINKLWNVASCWLYSANILAIHGHMNVKCLWGPLVTARHSNINAPSLSHVQFMAQNWQTSVQSTGLGCEIIK